MPFDIQFYIASAQPDELRELQAAIDRRWSQLNAEASKPAFPNGRWGNGAVVAPGSFSTGVASPAFAPAPEFP